MCNNCVNEVKEYINIQTGEKLDLERVSTLPDNSMLKTNSDLWIEWDFEKNSELGLDIWKMTRGCKYKAYWICKDCRENTFQFIKNKTRGHKCGYCSGKLASKTNNLMIKNPELASQWHPTKNGDLTPYDVTAVNDKKVWWLGECGHEWEAKVSNRTTLNSMCPLCEHSSSFSERVMYNALRLLSIDFNIEKKFNWSSNKRYDFYIPFLDIIIEMHGEQHYKKSRFKGARTLEEEQENDQYKYDLAITNGIPSENYIVIDCRKSDFEYIKNNIMNSMLAKIFDLDNVDWDVIYQKSCKDITLEIIELWNMGVSVDEISYITKRHKETIRRYLKEAKSLNKCDFTKEESKRRNINYNKQI